MKRLYALVFLFSLVFSQPFTAYGFYAETTPEYSDGSGTPSGGSDITNGESFSLGNFACGEPLITEEMDQQIDDYKKNDANMAEKFVTSQAQNLFRIGDLNGLSTLVFGNPYCVWAGDGTSMSSDGVFTTTEREKIVEPLIKLFSTAFFLVLTLSMLISSLKLGFSSVRGRGLSDFSDDAWMWLLAIGLSLGYGMLTNLVFQMNAALVLSIKDVINDNGVSLSGLSVVASWNFNPLTMGPFLVTLFAEWLLSLLLNFIYLARKVVICLLLVLGYVAIYSLMFAKTRAFFGTWMREFVGNVFLQSIHAIVLYSMVMFSSTGASSIFKLGMMIMFIPVSGMISKWLNIGDSSSKAGSIMTMAGVGGLASMVMLSRQAGNIVRGGSLYNSGGSLTNSNSSNDSSNSSLSNLANSLANDSAATSISTSASGVNSPMWNAAKNIVGSHGAGIGALAGMVGGPGGAMLGANAGRFVAESVMQSGRNVSSGLMNTMNAVKQGRSFTNEQGSGFRAMLSPNANAQALGTRRETFANIGESIGSMVGFNGLGAKVGRNVGLALSGVSRNRLASEMSSSMGLVDGNGNAKPMTLSNLSTQYPNADVKWLQTNEGSGFYMNTGDGEWKQIGLKGAADASLKDGEIRAMDYKLTDPSLQYEMQPNGTYKAPITTSNDAISIGADTSTVLPFDEAMKKGQVPTFDLASNGMNVQGKDQSVVTSSLNNLDTSSPLNVKPEYTTTNTADELHGDSGHQNIPPSPLENLDTNSPLNANPEYTTTNVPNGVSGENGHLNIQPHVPSSLENLDTSSPMNVKPEYTTTNVPNGVPGDNSQSTNPSSEPLERVVSKPNSSMFSDQRMETVGLKGSTPHLMRTSDAYIVGSEVKTLDNGQITKPSSELNPNVASHVANVSTGARHQDMQFRSERVNADAYLYHNPVGADTRTATDKVAEKVERGGEIRNRWKVKFAEQQTEKRNKHIS